jgi:hypothetical protein
MSPTTKPLSRKQYGKLSTPAPRQLLARVTTDFHVAQHDAFGEQPEFSALAPFSSVKKGECDMSLDRCSMIIEVFGAP